MYFVDTNIFIRHLTRDDPEKARVCFALFQKARDNKITLTTTESVISEIVYVLSSSRQIYTLSREEIRNLLYPLLSLPGFRIPHRRTFLRALNVYAAHDLDFEDALLIAHMERQNIKEIYSYDRSFDKIESIKRVEP